MGVSERTAKEKKALTSRLLLDTHILVWWLADPKRLSREQIRAIRASLSRGHDLTVSAVTVLEIAVLFGRGTTRGTLRAEDLLREIGMDSTFRIAPITLQVAREVAALGRSLADPMDRAIVATARVENLSLVTADQRIIDSDLVAVVI
jgi:PIN domain nuclease of toxin-antitoxin system